MASARFANYIRKTLAANLAAVATSATVDSVTGLPDIATTGYYFYLVLVRLADNAMEIVKVTAVTGMVLTIVRAQGGTTALAFVIGDRAELWLTADGINDLRTEVEAYAAALHASGPPDGMVDTDALAASAVTTAKIAAGNVTTGCIATGGVEEANIKDLAVTTGKVAAAAITPAKISNIGANYVIIGDGTAGVARAVGGDISVAHATGIFTIGTAAVGDGKIDPKVLRYAAVTLANAEVLAIDTAGHVIIPAEMSNIHVVSAAALTLHYGGAPYTWTGSIGDTLALRYGTAVTGTEQAASLFYVDPAAAGAGCILLATGDALQIGGVWHDPLTGGAWVGNGGIYLAPTTTVVNHPVALAASPGVGLGGGHADSTLTVHVWYRTIPAP